MINITDINEKISSDFGDKATEAFEILTASIAKAGHLNQPRIIRCIVFLADKNIEKLKVNTEAAISDPRDVMLWAEYANYSAGQHPKRIRDFSKTFDRSETDVVE